MENATETELVHNWKHKTDTEHNTDNDQVCRCCYILLKTHFLQCRKKSRRRRYRCKTCDVKFTNKTELRTHRREKHPQKWKQEQLKKIPKVLLEDDDDGDDDQDIGYHNTKPELNHEMTKEPNEDENSLVNQLTENQEFLNGMGTSEVSRNESTGLSEDAVEISFWKTWKSTKKKTRLPGCR